MAHGCHTAQKGSVCTPRAPSVCLETRNKRALFRALIVLASHDICPAFTIAKMKNALWPFCRGDANKAARWVMMACLCAYSLATSSGPGPMLLCKDLWGRKEGTVQPSCAQQLWGGAGRGGLGLESSMTGIEFKGTFGCGCVCTMCVPVFAS